MFRTLPPSGSPISALDLLGCISDAFNRPDLRLASSLGQYLDTGTVGLFSTGRGAMTFLMKQLRAIGAPEGRNTVILPSYTCYSVAASTLKAGLNVRVCDIDQSSLTYDPALLASVRTSDVIAIVSSNLFGMPDDLVFLEKYSRENGLYMIDDAAQALGASFDGRWVGTFGNAGLLSFDKGKVITSVNGGALISNDKVLADALRPASTELPDIGLPAKLVETLKVLAYSLLLHPRAYWLPANNPFLGLGKTRYDEDFDVARYFTRLAPIVLRQLRRLEQINDRRRRCASQYDSAIVESEAVRKFRVFPGSVPIFLRYPIRIRDERARSRYLRDFQSSGVSVSYPDSLPDVQELRGRLEIHDDRYENGRIVSREIVTLPTHRFVKSADIQNICRGLTALT